MRTCLVLAKNHDEKLVEKRSSMKKEVTVGVKELKE